MGSQQATVRVEFPVTSLGDTLCCDNIDEYRCRLDSDASRLFLPRHERVEVIYLQDSSNGTELQCVQIANEANLATFLETSGNLNQDYFFIFQQQDSWSQILTTREAFQQVLSFHSVFSPFWNFVHAFGFKVSEIDDTNRVCDGYRRRISYTEKREPRSYEFCFNLHSYEKNGSKTGNPWSLRQMGIYQKFDLHSQKHVWILLQPFSLAQRTLTRILKRCALQGSISGNHHPMSLHARFLDIAALNWSAYLGDLRNDIDILNEKACFSRVGRPFRHDYEVHFSDAQRLQHIRQKLLRALSVLNSSLEVCDGFSVHCKDLERFGIPSLEMCGEIETYTTQLRSHKCKIEVLLDHTMGIASLLFRILEYRSNESVFRSSEALQHNIARLELIADDTREENKRMSVFSEQAGRDSRSIKALTLVATIYLPASFIATMFNSNLVQVRDRNLPTEATHLVIAKESWIYVVITLVLMALTMVLTMVLEKRWR